MKIDRNMNLQELAEHMGDCTTSDEAELMRALLVASPYENTQHVPAHEWFQLLDRAAPRP